VVYTIDAVSFGATLIAAWLLPSLPSAADGAALSLSSVAQGLRYLASQRLLGATLGLDFIAMSFGMPKAVFPALG